MSRIEELTIELWSLMLIPVMVTFVSFSGTRCSWPAFWIVTPEICKRLMFWSEIRLLPVAAVAFTIDNTAAGDCHIVQPGTRGRNDGTAGCTCL